MTNPVDLMTFSVNMAQHSTAMMTLIYMAAVITGFGMLYAVIATAIRDALKGLRSGVVEVRGKQPDEARAPSRLRAVS